MAGAPAVGALVALWGFWILIVLGLWRGDLGAKGVAVFVALWLAGLVALRSVLYGFAFAPYVALLDVALVFAVFKGDIRIT
jgi:hypothetical protein